jgi:hypothetical protein
MNCNVYGEVTIKEAQMDYDNDIYAGDGDDNIGETILKGLRCEVDRWIDLVDDKNQ